MNKSKLNIENRQEELQSKRLQEHIKFYSRILEVRVFEDDSVTDFFNDCTY